MKRKSIRRHLKLYDDLRSASPDKSGMGIKHETYEFQGYSLRCWISSLPAGFETKLLGPQMDGFRSEWSGHCGSSRAMCSTRPQRSGCKALLRKCQDGCSKIVLFGTPTPQNLCVFRQQQNFAMGSLAQISSGAIRCSFNTRFRTRLRRVLVQIPREISDGFPVQIPREVLEGSGEDTC